MAPTILPPAAERFEIHNAVCRARRQGLVCSTCSDLHERAVRAYDAAVARLVEAA
jgi:hypothetical protein